MLAAGLAVGLALSLWGFWIEPDRLVVEPAKLCVPRWPAALDGFTVAALGDLHVGAPHIDLEKLRQVVDETNRLQPDLIVLLGDYVITGVAGGRLVQPEQIAPELGRLKARSGVLAVLGNHDWWLDAPRIRKSLEGAGIRVLENEAAELSARGQAVWVSGLGEVWGGHADVPAALAKVPAGATTLVLVHNPDIFRKIPDSVALTLAAHTHGGQVWLPLLGRLVVPSEYGERYAAGHVVEDGRHLYVTTGVGTSIIPVRFCVPPQISLLRLGPCAATDLAEPGDARSPRTGLRGRGRA